MITFIKMVMTTRLQEQWATSCALAGLHLAMMATYSLSQGNSGLFILRGMCSRSEHHAMLRLVSFVVLDTSEGVVIPGSQELVNMLRGHYMTALRGGLLEINQNAFPSFFHVRMVMFHRQEKVLVNPAKRIAINKAMEIMVSDGCECGQANAVIEREPCVDCESVKVMLLRLGFITRDDITHIESRLMGEWWEDTIHGRQPVPYPEPVDSDNTVMSMFVGSQP